MYLKNVFNTLGCRSKDYWERSLNIIQNDQLLRKVNELSKQKQKYIQSLHLKKYRQQFGVFLVEGQKSIEELLASDFQIEELFLSEKAKGILKTDQDVTICSETELSRISTFKNNNFGLALVKEKENSFSNTLKNEWVLAIDSINDPGNLGTIIRIADWYGITKIVCSENTVEFYHPRVISSSMGSFTRVSCFYSDLELFLKEINLPVFGAYLEGQSIHEQEFPASGVLMIGSESHGISVNLEKHVSQKITIPSFGSAESLNAGVATAIILDNIKRSHSGT